MNFEKKQLTPTKRVCLRLKEARKNAYINLADLSKQTKISIKHLQALEDCRFDDIPYAFIYKKNFIRRYAEILNLPSDDILNQFLVEELNETKDKIQPKSKKINKNKFQNLPSILRMAFSGVIILLVVGYLGWQIRSILKPPKLILFSPANGYITEDPLILVHGETNDEVNVYINGQKINNRQDGQFKETINLSPGINTIVISAEKKHGKTTKIIRHVTLKNSKQISLNKH